MKVIIRLFIFICCILLVSCGSRKRVVDSSTLTPATEIPVAEPSTTTTPATTKPASSPLQNIVKTVNANRQEETYATAKVNLSLSSGSKSASVGGTLRMKRNDVIQLSLVSLGIFEVGKLEVTPDYFMVIDKMGKQYLKASFENVPFLKKVGVDFYTLQSLFWDELFLLTNSKTMPTDKQFKKSQEGEKARLTNSDSQLAVLSFLVNTASGLIQKTSVLPHTQGSSPYLNWEYADFSKLGKKSFPSKYLITIANGSNPIKANLSLSNLKNDSNWETRTAVPGRNYKEVTVDKLLSRIMNLTK